MAFLYSDGHIYESDFHYWYIYGVKPKVEEKLKVIDKEIQSAEGALESRLVHSRRSAERRFGRRPGWCK